MPNGGGGQRMSWQQSIFDNYASISDAWGKFGLAVLGGVVSLVGKELLDRHRRPLLEIAATVVPVKNFNNELYYRLRVSNSGKTAALKCRIIAQYPISGRPEEMFDLSWSDMGVLEVTIPSKTFRDADVYRTVNRALVNEWLEFLGNNNYQPLRFSAITFYATAENAKTAKRREVRLR